MDSWFSGKREDVLNHVRLTKSWDVIVIGGGITGAGVAREAARQGKRVLLLEQKDFAWGSSSRSSKMVHGGLRYLASGNLKLTSHSVKERERLLREAPGLVDLLSYCWPHFKGQFPGPFILNTLLAVYDFFAGKRYRKFMKPEHAQYELPYLRKKGLLGYTRFSDAVTDDSRLVLRVLREAAKDGACVLNYCKVESLITENGNVSGALAYDSINNTSLELHAKVVVSATGAWADHLRKSFDVTPKIRPLRGSHLVFPSWRLSVAQSITLKHPTDKRSMFIFPWEGMTVVGTTDLDHITDSREPYITQPEVDYLLTAANDLFPNQNLTENDVISTWSGVRPIVSSGLADPSSEKRDHTIWDDHGLITVSGGKLTTFRLIALDVISAASNYITDLDGRDHGLPIFSEQKNIPYHGLNLPKTIKRRLAGFYGIEMQSLLAVTTLEDWTLIPGTQTYWAQLKFAAACEFVQHLDDLLLRRTRIGLLLKQGGCHIAEAIKLNCQTLLGWSDERWEHEWVRYLSIWQAAYSLPSKSMVKNSNLKNIPLTTQTFEARYLESAK